MRSLRALPRNISFLMSALVLILMAGLPTDAGAQVVLPSPELPPESDPVDCDNLISLYSTPEPHFAVFQEQAIEIAMTDARHRCFENVIRQAIGSDEIETFDSVLDVSVDIGRGTEPATLTGPVVTRTCDKVDIATGTFDTEIVDMSLYGEAGGLVLMLRESPTLASQGQVMITDLGGGLYQVDSFFDVFTELSVDGGASWTPARDVARIELVLASPTPVEQHTWGTIKCLFD